MKAVIKLDVPDWQIGQEVSVYFPDTMVKHGICELENEQTQCEDCQPHNNLQAATKEEKAIKRSDVFICGMIAGGIVAVIITYFLTNWFV